MTDEVKEPPKTAEALQEWRAAEQTEDAARRAKIATDAANAAAAEAQEAAQATADAAEAALQAAALADATATKTAEAAKVVAHAAAEIGADSDAAIAQAEIDKRLAKQRYNEAVARAAERQRRAP
jgi:hypothetical protein